MEKNITPIFLHEYRLTSHDKERIGIQAVIIETISESPDAASLEAVTQALRFFERNCNISHKIVITGYKQND